MLKKPMNKALICGKNPIVSEQLQISLVWRLLSLINAAMSARARPAIQIALTVQILRIAQLAQYAVIARAVQLIQALSSLSIKPGKFSLLFISANGSPTHGQHNSAQHIACAKDWIRTPLKNNASIIGWEAA